MKLMCLPLVSGAMYANSPTIVGERTADGALMLLLAAFRGVVTQVRRKEARDGSSS